MQIDHSLWRGTKHDHTIQLNEQLTGFSRIYLSLQYCLFVCIVRNIRQFLAVTAHIISYFSLSVENIGYMLQYSMQIAIVHPYPPLPPLRIPPMPPPPLSACIYDTISCLLNLDHAEMIIV